MILKGRNYNPKLDYLFCKSFLKLPDSFDEYELREAFESKASTNSYQEKIINIKELFKSKSIDDFDNTDWNNFLSIILNDNLNFKFESIDLKNITLIKNTFDKLLLSYTYEVSVDILHIVLVYSYFSTNKELLIIHHNRLLKLCKLLQQGNLKMVDIILNRIYTKLKKLNQKHSLTENIKFKENLKDYCKECLKLFNLKGIGIYGSFSTNTDTKYSDVDILVVVEDDFTDFKSLKHKLYEFWNLKTILNIDLKIIKSYELDLESIAVRKSFKLLSGRL